MEIRNFLSGVTSWVFVWSVATAGSFSSIPVEVVPDLKDPGLIQIEWDGMDLEVLEKGKVSPSQMAPQKNPTYFVDYDVGFDATHKSVVAKFGRHPTLVQLKEFVAASISKKGINGDILLASQVASSLSGDCSEHAVLLAALGRSFGYDVRLVVGFAVIKPKDSGATIAVGHMWNEARVGKKWTVIDATQIETAKEFDVYHVPIGVLGDESESFRMDLLSLIAKMPQRVRLHVPKNGS